MYDDYADDDDDDKLEEESPAAAKLDQAAPVLVQEEAAPAVETGSKAESPMTNIPPLSPRSPLRDNVVTMTDTLPVPATHGDLRKRFSWEVGPESDNVPVEKACSNALASSTPTIIARSLYCFGQSRFPSFRMSNQQRSKE